MTKIINETKLREIIYEAVYEAVEANTNNEVFTDDIMDTINGYINDVNEYVRPFGLSVVFNKNYSFGGYSAEFLAVYQARSAATGKIRIGINLPYLKEFMSKHGVPLRKLKEQLNISIWHETGHGIVEFLKRLRRKNTQTGSDLFNKQMISDFKYILKNEEEVVEEFGAMQEGYATYSDLDDFICRYENEIIELISL